MLPKNYCVISYIGWFGPDICNRLGNLLECFTRICKYNVSSFQDLCRRGCFGSNP